MRPEPGSAYAGGVGLPGRIESIADTARWTAAWRALETARPDALFHDPYAARLAGERGLALAAALPRSADAAGSVAVRTHVIDRRILVATAVEGVDTVLNLGAGLDARAYRLALPASLRWIDVDLPALVAHKEAVLAGAAPRCHLENVALDLADGSARRALFRRVAADARRALVITEGLLVYLAPAEVAALATDLHAAPRLDRWLTDLGSPLMLAELGRLWGDALDAGGAALRFGPAEGARFFRRHGFRVTERRALWDELHRFGRALPSALRQRIDAGEAAPAVAAAVRALGSIVLLERTRPAEIRDPI
jgi:methyltransferase (TIGR00027 family)